MEMVMLKSIGILNVEIFLRILSMILLILTACLVGLDTQTELVFGMVKRKATVKDLDALQVLVIVASVLAGYNFLQLSRCFFIRPDFKRSSNSKVINIKLAWFCFLLDQVAAYTCLAATAAATQASMLAVTGADSFQWMKLCNTYTRFCFQIGGSLFCSLAASILMSTISSILAFNLFRHYSSNKLLVLKSLQQ